MDAERAKLHKRELAKRSPFLHFLIEETPAGNTPPDWGKRLEVEIPRVARDFLKTEGHHKLADLYGRGLRFDSLKALQEASECPLEVAVLLLLLGYEMGVSPDEDLEVVVDALQDRFIETNILRRTGNTESTNKLILAIISTGSSFRSLPVKPVSILQEPSQAQPAPKTQAPQLIIDFINAIPGD